MYMKQVPGLLKTLKKALTIMVISPGKTPWSFLGGTEGTFWGQAVNKWVRSRTLCTKTFEDQPLYIMFSKTIIQTRESWVAFQASFRRIVKHSFTSWGKITFKISFWFKGRKLTSFFIFLLSASYSLSQSPAFHIKQAVPLTHFLLHHLLVL